MQDMMSGSMGRMFNKIKAPFVELNKFWKEQNGRLYMKVLMTYMQVLGSFAMFSVEWPPDLMAAIVCVKGIFQFDLFQFEGLACLGNEVDLVSSQKL